MAKKRLDLLMVERGLAGSRTAAQRMVMAGRVRVEGELELKPSTLFADTARIEVEHGPPFVSRGGEKLEAALHTFHIKVSGLKCADVGASTGGFTDCLLQHGAEKVYAIDVGKGILHWKLRQDKRVVVMEGVNARHLARLPEQVSLVTIDASFISLKILLPTIRSWFVVPAQEGLENQKPLSGIFANVIALVKPQFEAGRAEAARGQGVIRDPLIHRAILEDILVFAAIQNFQVKGLIRSPLIGPKGNIEFLAWFELFEEEFEKAQRSTIDQIVGPLFSELH
jgi:23S rRNA (cytidine1920-2'-O)/16S rRNA (cytidine1409-2'-O)-methyltransferase